MTDWSDLSDVVAPPPPVLPEPPTGGPNGEPGGGLDGEPNESGYWLRPPVVRTVMALTMGALAFDLVFRAPTGLVTSMSLGLLLGAALVGGWVSTTAGRVCLVAAIAPLLMLMIRASWWLIPLNVIAVLGLVLLASELRDEPDAVSRAAGRLLRPTPALFSLVSWPGLLVSLVTPMFRLLPSRLRQRPSGQGAGALARGLIITAPVVLVLVLLLGSSDALFGSLFTTPAAPEQLVSHAARLVVGFALTAILATRALRRTVEPTLRVSPVLGRTELTMLLGAVTAIYTVFVAVQVVAALAGSAYVQETTGLTVAEYARSGFFQLLAAAAFTLAVLLAGKRHAGESAPMIGVLNQVAVVLTLSTVAVAVRRLFLYEDAFGLTMLRLYTMVFAVFIALVFLLTAAHLADRLPFAHLTGVLGVAFGFLLFMNIVNPEAVVADRNLDRADGLENLDGRYLVHDLGTDAVPRLLESAQVTRTLCRTIERPDNRLAYYNRSRVQAFSLLDEACPDGWGD